jgi:hypothetical protein
MYDVINVLVAARVIVKKGNTIRRISNGNKKNIKKNNNSNPNLITNINTDIKISEEDKLQALKS